MTERHPLPLKGHLVNRGLTLTELAPRIGYTVDHTSLVLNRRKPLTRAFALACVRELGLGVDEAALLLGPPATWTRGRWPHTT